MDHMHSDSRQTLGPSLVTILSCIDDNRLRYEHVGLSLYLVKMLFFVFRCDVRFLAVATNRQSRSLRRQCNGLSCTAYYGRVFVNKSSGQSSETADAMPLACALVSQGSLGCGCNH